MARVTFRLIAIVLALAAVVFSAVPSLAAQKPVQTTKKQSSPKRPAFPADRDAAVVAVAREVLRQIYSGKVDPALMTLAMRERFTTAKIKSLKNDLSSYGPVKSVTLVDRKPSDGKDIATLKVKLGDTVFIGTMTVTNDNRIDTFLLLEE